MLIAASLCLHLQAQAPQGSSTSTDPLQFPSATGSGAGVAGSSANTSIVPGGGGSIGNSATSGTGTSGEADGTQSLNTSVSLSTDQILTVLQEQPEALGELKSLVADQATQQGTPIQPDSITDEMLYNRIASSPSYARI